MKLCFGLNIFNANSLKTAHICTTFAKANSTCDDLVIVRTIYKMRGVPPP